MVHVRFIFTRPMKGFSAKDLQPIEIDTMAPVQLNVTPGKIVTDNSHQFHRAEETGGYRGMTGRSAEQTRVLRLGSFDRIQRRRANDENTHSFRAVKLWKRPNDGKLTQRAAKREGRPDWPIKVMPLPSLQPLSVP